MNDQDKAKAISMGFGQATGSAGINNAVSNLQPTPNQPVDSSAIQRRLMVKSAPKDSE